MKKGARKKKRKNAKELSKGGSQEKILVEQVEAQEQAKTKEESSQEVEEESRCKKSRPRGAKGKRKEKDVTEKTIRR